MRLVIYADHMTRIAETAEIEIKRINSFREHYGMNIVPNDRDLDALISNGTKWVATPVRPLAETRPGSSDGPGQGGASPVQYEPGHLGATAVSAS